MVSSACHKMLHRARSLKKILAEEKPSHKRQVSVSSDVSRASSSGSDTFQRGNSVEWDPLRLHPSMEVDRSPHIMPRYDERRYQLQEQPHHIQHVEQIRQFHPPRHTQPGFSLEIYDGFDFGFGKPQTLTTTSESNGGGGRRLRAPKSEADLRRPIEIRPTEWGESDPPSPTRRPYPAGFDEADFFLKRGGWKRRGIVFGCSEEARESEDDCFEIP